MVNRNKLNEIAIKMGLKKITFFNKFDNSLKDEPDLWQYAGSRGGSDLPR